MKTYMANKEKIEKKWYLVDADGKVLGRLATRIAMVLRGKTKPEYTPHVDCGDFVVVVNSEKIKVTGKKMQQKEYDKYSGYQGGRKVIKLETLMAKHPEDVIRKAVKGMLPRGPLGTDMFSKLKVYKGNEHPHKAQNLEDLKI